MYLVKGIIDCEQSLFFFKFSKGSARVRVCVCGAFFLTEQEKRETARNLKQSQPTVEESMFFNALNDLTEATQQYLEEEFCLDMASPLSSPLYYKQVEYTDKKGKTKTKNDESASPVLY